MHHHQQQQQQQQKQVLRIQTVMFIRHGVGKHNIRVNGQSPNLHDASLTDPPLVFQGKRQALEASRQVQQWFSSQNSKVQLVVTSPLTRCLQTTAIMFVPGGSDEYISTDQQNYPEPPRIVCMESVREAFGQHYPDKRRCKSQLQAVWRNVAEWDVRMTQDDSQWSATRRETRQDVVRRIHDFFQWLVQQPQDNVVVVSHGVWIECCFEAYCPGALGNGERVHNCDLYVGQVVSSNGVFSGLQHVGRAFPKPQQR